MDLSAAKMRTDSLRKKETSCVRPGRSAAEAPASESQGEEVAAAAAAAPTATDLEITQPGLGVTTTTITTVTQTGGGWSTGLFDVCADITTCNAKTHRF